MDQNGTTDPEIPMAVRKLLKEKARKALLWILEKEIPFTERTEERHTPKPLTIKIQGIQQPREYPDLKGPEKTRLVLASLLHIHDSIVDADAWQGYEGTPDQIDKLRWEVYGILAKNPEVTTTEEVHDIWLEDYATAELQKDLGWVPEDMEEDEDQGDEDLLTPTDYSNHQIQMVEDQNDKQ